jgi:hypothetical protein
MAVKAAASAGASTATGAGIIAASATAGVGMSIATKVIIAIVAIFAVAATSSVTTVAIMKNRGSSADERSDLGYRNVTSIKARYPAFNDFSPTASSDQILTASPVTSPSSDSSEAQASATPSSVPSFSVPQAIIKVEFDAVFTLQGLTLFDVPVDEELLEFEASIQFHQEDVTPVAKNVEVAILLSGVV